MLKRFAATVLAAASLSGLAYAADDSYPSRPIRVIVPFAPGGSTDTLIRSVGQRLNELTGQPIVIDNRGGAGGAIGAELAARSTPDGYTIMATTSGVIVANPSLYAKLNYNPVTDFDPVTIIAGLTNILVVSSSSPAKTVGELLAMAKAKPGVLTYGSGGIGTSNHLAAELMKHLTHVDMIHVPYKGGGPAVRAAIAGEVTMLFATIPTVLQQVKTGKLRALAVTSRERAGELPQVPTMIESGVKDYEVQIWIGVLAPHGTPPRYIQKLNNAIKRAITSPDLGGRLRAGGYNLIGNSPSEMAAVIKTESARWGAVIRQAGIRAE